MTDAESVLVAMGGMVVALAIGAGVESLVSKPQLPSGLGRMLAPQTDEGWRNLDSKTSYWGSCDYDSPTRTGE